MQFARSPVLLISTQIDHVLTLWFHFYNVAQSVLSRGVLLISNFMDISARAYDNKGQCLIALLHILDLVDAGEERDTER